MGILANAAQVLRCFEGEAGELTFTDVVRATGLPKSNASRLLRAMRDVDLLETTTDQRLYRPGPVVHAASRAKRRASPLIARADAVVARICAECGHTGYVSRREGREVMAVTDHPGTHALRVVSSIGRRLPAFASATGRSLLARLDDAEVRALHPEPFAAPSDHAPQSARELLARLRRVRRDGFATSHDEATRGVDAVAVAVGDPSRGEEASLCVVFPAAMVDAAERLRIARALHAGAQEIAALTGDDKLPPWRGARRETKA